MHTTFVNEPLAIRKMHKTVFYYGEGEDAEARRLATLERAAKRVGFTRDASAFNGEIENCNVVVILPNVRGNDRKKIEGAYRGDLIAARGSDRWQGGEIKSLHAPEEKPTEVIVPDNAIVSGPKADPEQVNLKMAETNVPYVPPQPPPPRPRGRPRKVPA